VVLSFEPLIVGGKQRELLAFITIYFIKDSLANSSGLLTRYLIIELQSLIRHNLGVRDLRIIDDYSAVVR
jgi:hypothetical protein